MGREIRRVPVDFQHPIAWCERYKPGRFDGGTYWGNELQPMHDQSLSEAQAEWDRGLIEWPDSRNAGLKYDEEMLAWAIERVERTKPTRGEIEYIDHVRAHMGETLWDSYEEYAGERPGHDPDDARYYQPEGWPPPEARGYVVYETVSEGTPITPTFATEDELINWLATKGTAWDKPMSREGAERFVRGMHYVPSMMTGGGTIRNGLEIAEPVAASTDTKNEEE